jgi:hypothetical protein
MLMMLPTSSQGACRILWSLLLMQQVLSSQALDWEVTCIFVGRSHRKGVGCRVLKSFLLWVSSFALTYSAGCIFQIFLTMRSLQSDKDLRMSWAWMLRVHKLEWFLTSMIICHHWLITRLDLTSFKFNSFLHTQV